MKCECGNTKNFETDPARGETHCAECGRVVESGAVVSEIAFSNNRMVGTFVTEGKIKYGGKFMGNKALVAESSELRLQRAYKTIDQIAARLSLGNDIVGPAQRLF